MRQGKGTELLGTSDPRSASIGIIYVSPNDDRKSVLAAILTQEKLGRKQVAVVLPNQNKAFQRPQDFDDLRTIRRKLQAQIVFIAPAGVADLARKRRFPVYASLENYARALRDEEPGQVEEKKGWFGRGKPKETPRRLEPQGNRAEVVTPPAPPLAVSSGTVATAGAADPRTGRPEPDPRSDHPRAGRPAATGAVARGAAMAAGGALLGAGIARAQQNQDEVEEGQFRPRPDDTQFMAPVSFDDGDDWDALPPTPTPQSPATPANPANDAAAAPVRPAPTPPTGPTPVEDDKIVTDPHMSAPTRNGDPADGPTIIELPRRKTDKLTPREEDKAVAAATPRGDNPARAPIEAEPLILPDPANPPNRGAPRRRKSGKIGGAAAAGAAGLAAGAAAGAALSRTGGNGGAASTNVAGSALPQRPPVKSGAAAAGGAAAVGSAPTRIGGGGGNIPPQPPGGGGGGGGGPRRPGSRRWLIATILLVLVALLLIGGLALAYMSPNTIQPIGKILTGGPTAATITITPDSKRVEDSYLIQAVTGTPNANAHQVSLRQLTYTTPTQTKTVKATGHAQVPATTAKGRLTFINGSFSSSYTVGTTTAIPAGGGVTVAVDVPATIPAGNLSTGAVGTITVSAHALTPGTAGNIGALTINQTCCSPAGNVAVKNLSAFTGGQDPKDYTFLQQSDVNGTVNSMQDTLSKQALNNFKGQIHPNEQLLNGPSCAAKPNVDQPIGDQGKAVTSATVSVTATCTGQVYDQQGVQTLVGSLLQAKAATSPGAGYKLVGKTVTSTSIQNQGQNSVSLIVKGWGIWAYSFTEAQQNDMKSKIVGTTVNQAQTLLKGMRGVGNVTVQTTGSTLPTDPTQITIVVQSVTGLTGGSTPPAVATPAPGSISPASPNGQVTPIPGNGSVVGTRFTASIESNPV